LLESRANNFCNVLEIPVGQIFISGGAKYLSSFLKFEVKNRRIKRGRSKIVTFAVCYFCVIFQSNKIVLTLETHFNKSISVSGGLWAESPAAGRRCCNFTTFSKKYAFLGIFWPICMKIQRGKVPCPSTTFDAYAYCSKCVLSV